MSGQRTPNRPHDPHMCYRCSSWEHTALDWGKCNYRYVDGEKSGKPKSAYNFGCLLWNVEAGKGA